MSPEIQRETKSQRKERERAERKAQEVRKLRNMQTRRLLLGGSLATLITVGIAGTTFTLLNQPNPREASTTIDVIEEEIKRLGIKRSQKEYDLWTKNGYQKAIKPIPVSQIDLGEAIGKVKSTLDLMDQSENPYFKEATAILSEHQIAGDLILRMIESAPNMPEGLSAIAPITRSDGRLGADLVVIGDAVVNKFNALGLAMSLTHEMEHARSIFANINNPSLSYQQKREIHLNRRVSRDEALKEEGRGYAKGALAYIHQRGLMGNIDTSSDDERNQAVAFIRANNDPTDTRWLNFLERTVGFSLPPK